MLRNLLSDDPRFKSLTFSQGLNLLVADKTQGSSFTDTRNGAGKSSLIEILHFLLGMGRLTNSVLSNKILKPHSYTLNLDWSTDSGALSVRRSLSKPGRVVLSGDTDEPHSILDSRIVSNTEWVDIIGRGLFSLPEEHNGLSARALVSLYIRRVSQHSFNDPVKTFPTQAAAIASANVAYLLGLDWRLAASYQDLAAREALRKKLKQAIDDPAFRIVVGSVSELRGLIASASQRTNVLEEQVRSFRVVPEYEHLQSRADDLDAEIRATRAQDAADRRNLQDLESAIRSDSEPEVNYLDRVYRELGIQLPEATLRRYDEVERFHNSVAINRRSYLEEELASTRQRLSERKDRRAAWGEEHARLLQVLNEGGALDALTSLQEELSVSRAKLEALKTRYETAKNLESTQTEIKVERSKVQHNIGRDLASRESQINEINLLFQSYATRLYGPGREAYVEITPLDTSLRITPHIGGQDSEGIRNMVIFCFDLTIAVIAHRANRGPNFLVHDSHLFDGVDERQVAGALQLAEETCEIEGMQYIATLNSDKLEKVESRGVDLNPFILSPRLTDAYADGGLFGFRFE